MGPANTDTNIFTGPIFLIFLFSYISATITNSDIFLLADIWPITDNLADFGRCTSIVAYIWQNN